MASSDPAPLITVNITSANGSSDVKVLPDSGADISASGREILVDLNEQPNKLTSADVIPRKVNATKIFPLGKLPVTLRLGNQEYAWKMYTFTQMSMALSSLGKHAKLSKYCHHTIHKPFHHQQYIWPLITSSHYLHSSIGRYQKN